MQLQGKVWGTTRSILQKPNFEVHRIEVKKGGFCSTHSHKYKFNAFFIEQGVLRVSVYQKDYDLRDDTILLEGDLTIVKPDLNHFFEALEDTICYEMYWTELNHSDIQRKNIGGVK